MKKLLALLLALVFVFALAACGGDAGEENKETDENTDTSENETEMKTDVLTIGIVAHESGWFADYDLNNIYETQALAAIINEEGGITIGDTTYTIELEIEDGQTDYDAVRSACIALADNEDIDYVIETNDFWVTTGEDVFEEAGIMHISCYTTGDTTYMSEEMVNAFAGTNGAYGDFLIAFEILTKLYTDVETVVYVNDDNGVTDEMLAMITSYGEQYGITVLQDNITYEGAATDMTATALQVIESGADAFIGNGTLTNMGAILKEVRAQGSDMVCAAVSGQNASNLLEICGEDAAYNAFTLGGSFEEEDNTEIRWKVYSYILEEYGEDVAMAFDGHMASTLWTLLDIMQECGSIEVEDVEAAWESGTTFDTLNGEGIVGGSESYGVDNHAIATPTPYTYLEDGEVIFGGWITVEIP